MAVIVVGLGLVSWLVFSGTLGVRSPVQILVAEPRPQAQLWLAVAACDLAPQLASLVESEDEVRVEVTVWRRFRTHANDCSDSITIDLSQPLGERSAIDASTGQPVPRR
jgi:hypothetical protein